MSDGIWCVLERHRQDLMVIGIEGYNKGRGVQESLEQCWPWRREGIDEEQEALWDGVAKYCSSWVHAPKCTARPKNQALCPSWTNVICAHSLSSFHWNFPVHTFIHCLICRLRSLLLKCEWKFLDRTVPSAELSVRLIGWWDLQYCIEVRMLQIQGQIILG